MDKKKKEFDNRIRENSTSLKAFNELHNLNEQIKNDFKSQGRSFNHDFPTFEENPHENETPYVIETFDLSGTRLGDEYEL